MNSAEMIAALGNAKVLVIGDLMLDEYVTGSVSRVSPEAPVPVLKMANKNAVLGGAGNVAANISALGAEAGLVGILGNDEAGSRFIKLLENRPHIKAGITSVSDRPTTVKTRFISGQQQIVRVDVEETAPHSKKVADHLVQSIQDGLGDCGCVILSDYGKGAIAQTVLQATLKATKESNIPIVVDPKRRDISFYSGVDYLTPNRSELTLATGISCNDDTEAEQAALAAIQSTGSAILLTRSERGMTLYREGQPPFHLDAEKREVFDVSGAGDTVIAMVGASLAAGLSIEEGMKLANAAAGIVVGKLGTAVCTKEELLETLQRTEGSFPALPSPQTQLLPARSEAAQTVKSWQAEGLKVGFANGCFDLLHPGHISLIQQAADACDRLIVAINTDDSVRRLKGPSRPVQSQAARANVLLALKGVDMVVSFSEDTPLEIVKLLQPDLIVKGADYNEDDVVGGDIVKARGGRVLLVDLLSGHSTTSLVERASSS